jgi:hypothetical protein
MGPTFSRLTTNPAYLLLAAKQDDRLVGFAMGIVCEELYGNCKPFMAIEDLIKESKSDWETAGKSVERK